MESRVHDQVNIARSAPNHDHEGQPEAGPAARGKLLLGACASLAFAKDQRRTLAWNRAYNNHHSYKTHFHTHYTVNYLHFLHTKHKSHTHTLSLHVCANFVPRNSPILKIVDDYSIAMRIMRSMNSLWDVNNLIYHVNTCFVVVVASVIQPQCRCIPKRISWWFCASSLSRNGQYSQQAYIHIKKHNNSSQKQINMPAIHNTLIQFRHYIPLNLLSVFHSSRFIFSPQLSREPPSSGFHDYIKWAESGSYIIYVNQPKCVLLFLLVIAEYFFDFTIQYITI